MPCCVPQCASAFSHVRVQHEASHGQSKEPWTPLPPGRNGINQATSGELKQPAIPILPLFCLPKHWWCDSLAGPSRQATWRLPVTFLRNAGTGLFHGLYANEKASIATVSQVT